LSSGILDSMNLVDTHAHLDFTDDKKGWIERAKEAGVSKIICIGTSVEASRKCVEIADHPSHKRSLRSSSFGKLGAAGLKNASKIQEVAKRIPLDRLLLETDSPFLSPEPYRGKTNEPKNVRIVAEFIASLRNHTPDKIAEATSRNAERLFGI